MFSPDGAELPQPDNCSTSVRLEIDERAEEDTDVCGDHSPLDPKLRSRLPVRRRNSQRPHLSDPECVHTSPAVRAQYVNDNDLVNVPRDIAGFLGFYEARRARLEERLRNALGVA